MSIHLNHETGPLIMAYSSGNPRSGNPRSAQSNQNSTARATTAHTTEEMTKRLSNYETVSAHLASLSHEETQALLSRAEVLNIGIGGDVLKLEVAGVPFVAKKIRLSDQEPERSTANHFRLPLQYQYGVGSMGFGVWRELLAHEVTTQWVLDGECSNFPLMYGYKVLTHSSTPSPSTEESRKETEGYVAYWDNSQEIASRAHAVRNAADNVVVFMEFLPRTLHQWLKRVDTAFFHDAGSLEQLEHELFSTVQFMKSKGFIHFDAHFGNIFTDGQHVYFSDFGLAQSESFELSQEEKEFFEIHRHYDSYSIARQLVVTLLHKTLATEVPDRDERRKVVGEFLKTGTCPYQLPPRLASCVNKYRSVANILEQFFFDLVERSKGTRYPEDALREAWQVAQE